VDPTAATGSTLLLVEDDARIREALRLALTDEGHRAIERAGGARAGGADPAGRRPGRNLR